MARSKPGDSKRLSVDDWIEAGFVILAEEGQKSLKIERLCQQLGVTKGSFYWHFADIATYREVLVTSWSDLRVEERKWLTAMREVPPRDRLEKMMGMLTSPRHWMLERAMREWARTDPAAAASVTASDRRIMRAVRATFRDYGFDDAEADLRAEATFAAGVGFLHLSGAKPGRAAVAKQRRFLDFMLDAREPDA